MTQTDATLLNVFLMAIGMNKYFLKEGIDRIGLSEISKGSLLQRLRVIHEAFGLDAASAEAVHIATVIADSHRQISGIYKKYVDREYTAEEAFEKLCNSYTATLQRDLSPQLRDAARASAKPSITCKKGCSYCCEMQVSVSAVESEILRSLATPEVLSRVNSEASALESPADVDEFGKLAREKRACPFLVNSECSIYDKRPLACRNMVVGSDPKDCADYNGIVAYATPLTGWLFMDLCGNIMPTQGIRSSILERR